MALACRILAAEGHESALAGQITARGDQPETYWMLSFGLGFDEARASNIVLVDDDLCLLEGNGMVNPSNRFHLWIYRHRPSVNAIVHTHPPYCSALSIVGKPLVAAHMGAAMFYDDCAYLPEWPGPPIGDEEGRIIHEALGDNRAILLAHHGQLVATSTIEEAAVLAVFIERAARMQALAESIGTIKPIKPEIAREAHDYRLKPRCRRNFPLLCAPSAQAGTRGAGVVDYELGSLPHAIWTGHILRCRKVGDVRFWHKADITAVLINVRFWG